MCVCVRACAHREEAGEGCGWRHRWRESRHQKEAGERASSDSKRPREIKLEMRNNKRGSGRGSEGERRQGQQTGRKEIERGGK